MKRISAGFILAAFTLWICLAASPATRAAAILGFALICFAEVLRLARLSGDRIAHVVGFGFFALVALAGAPLGIPSWWSAVAPFLLTLSAGALALTRPGRMERTGVLLVGALWIGLPTLALLDIATASDGGRTLLFLIAVVVTGEVGALVVGRLIGGPKLAPGLSPGKTWAGLWSQLFVSAAVAMATGFLLPVAPGLPGLAGIGLLLAGAAALGDLYESRWKRSADRKDSGSLIPGHGGALDRADGLLFASLAMRAVLAVLPA